MTKANTPAGITSDDLWALPPPSSAQQAFAKFDPSFRQTRSIVTSYLSIFGWRFLFIGVLQVLIVAGTLYGPVVLQLVMELVESRFDMHRAILYVGSLFVVKLLQALICTHTTFQSDVIAHRFTSSLQQLVFQKVLVLDAKSRRDKTDIASLFTSDIMWIVSFSNYTHQVWIIPVQLGLVLYLLYNVLGYAAFVGAGIIVVTLVLNNGLAHAQRGLWRSLMVLKDKRMKVLEAAFSTIVDQKVETVADRQKLLPDIQAHREKELGALWGAFSLSAVVTAILYTAPILVTTASLAFYTLVLHQPITATKVFTSLALFRSLRAPLIGLPQITAHFMQALVALRRLRDFLNLTEKDPNLVLTPNQLTAVQYEQYATNNVDIAIEDGSFGWDADKPMFRGLNLQVKRAEVVILHGDDKSGKTSLCNVILGELEKYEGSVFVGGRVAYCSEDPWLQRLTIRDNILFGKPYDRARYNLVLEACGLRVLEDGFPFGDRTVVDGTKLSRADRIRVALARACYSDADIYVLDIAIDETTFQSCVLGLLRHKTVVLVSEDPAVIESPCIDKRFDVGKIVAVENKAKAKLHGHLVDALPKEAHILEQDVPSLHPQVWCDNLISPSMRSPYGMLQEEPRFVVDELPVPEFLQEDGDARVATNEAFRGYVQAAGWSFVVVLVLVQGLWQCVQVISDLWLSHWCTTSSLKMWSNNTIYVNGTIVLARRNATVHTDDTIVVSDAMVNAYSNWNMHVYAVLAVVCMAMVVVRTLLTSCAGIRASRRLFDDMTTTLVSAPLSELSPEYFGRILNVYNADINTIDTRLPFALGGFLANAFIAAFCLGACVVCLRFYGAVVMVCVILYVYFGTLYARPAQAIETLVKETRAPHLQFVKEAADGAVVIRAFGAKQVRRFHRVHKVHVDMHQEASYTQQVFAQWFALRMQLLHACLILTITLATVLSKSSLTPGLFGLVFNYALQVPPHVEFVFSIWSGVLTSMAGVHRVLDYVHSRRKIAYV
ncbi:hypothetical protein DYB32_000855 [Aphanomyces invadans]|uniref:ABC transmembrane type-1 domain-containing protein n=1 Tax=Aphanomyces invadans TaxID=157072 RepID=A0A418B8P6_9STRA|nr:hypothetical protein DYB32_000855 [Aphanomyces invadans]